jgi:DNA-binding LytR/AlgR family response regulator
MIRIKFDDILYIESLKNHIKVFTTNNKYLMLKSLTSITEKLPDNNFIRIHRSFTIALDKVSNLEGDLVEISTAKIPIVENILTMQNALSKIETKRIRA